MNDQPSAAPRISGVTWIGLFLSIFGILIVRQTVAHFYPTLTFTASLWKESFIWLCAIAVLLIVIRGERLPLTSIGIGTAPLWKSILWGFVLAILCLLIGSGLAVLTGYGHGPASIAFGKLPLWLISLTVVRAGVVEELFYRGYAIEASRPSGSIVIGRPPFRLSSFRSATGPGAGPTSLSPSSWAEFWPGSISGAAIWSRT